MEPGSGYTFIRPNLFMQGLLSFSNTIKAEDRFFAAAGDARVSVVDVRDNAAVAAAALSGVGHEGRTYTLTAPAALTHAELAEGLSETTGRPIKFINVPPDAMRNAEPPGMCLRGRLMVWWRITRITAAAKRPS